MDTLDYSVAIEEAKKYFFAEDIMSYYMISSGCKPYFQLGVPSRVYPLIPRAFNEAVEIAMTFLFSRISVYNTFRSFEANGMLNHDTFMIFTYHLEERYFSDGYDPQKFLYFCAYLAYMAVSFYKRGKTVIPKFALYCIVRKMKEFEVPEYELWNDLSIATLRYIKIAFSCGFAKMSDLKSMKIKLVVNRSFKDQTSDSSYVNESATNAEEKNVEDSALNAQEKIVEDSATNAEEKNAEDSATNAEEKNAEDSATNAEEKNAEDSATNAEEKNAEDSATNAEDVKLVEEILKLSTELKRKIPVIDDQCVSEIDKLSEFYLENFTQESLKEHNVKHPKKILEMKLGDKSIHENKSDTKGTHSLDVILDRIILKRKYHALKAMCSLANRSTDRPYPQTYKCSVYNNPNLTSKDIQSNAMDTDILASRSLNSNSICVTSDVTTSTEKDSNYFDQSKQDIQSSTSLIHSQKLTSILHEEKYCGFTSANLSNKSSPDLALNKEPFSINVQESQSPHTLKEIPNLEESEIKDCLMKTEDFDLCNKFLMDMVMSSGTDIELYGITHENFISNEDDFNCTFDILSVVQNIERDFGPGDSDAEAID